MLFCPRSGWKSVYKSIGICTRWKLDQTYKFRILLELLEGFGEAGVMEIVEDRLVPARARGWLISAIKLAMVGRVTHTGRLFVDQTVKLT